MKRHQALVLHSILNPYLPGHDDLSLILAFLLIYLFCKWWSYIMLLLWIVFAKLHHAFILNSIWWSNINFLFWTLSYLIIFLFIMTSHWFLFYFFYTLKQHHAFILNSILFCYQSSHGDILMILSLFGMWWSKIMFLSWIVLYVISCLVMVTSWWF